VAATGAALVTARGLRPSLPATAGALLHLGAFLVPVDVAAIGVRAELDWSTLLLAEGLVAVATFGWAARSERSVVLRWAFAAAVVALAGGIGATTALPAPLVLAACAAGALALHRDHAAVAWAAVAGIAPLLTFLDGLALTGQRTFERLGLVGDQPRAAALLTGALAAVVLAVAGRRRDDVGLALLGALVASTGAVASWTGLDRDPEDSLVGLAVVFLLLEAVAFATRRDAFWSRPAGILARAGELAAGLVTGPLVLIAVLVVLFEETDPRAALAAAVLGLGWVAAELRTGTGRRSSTIGVGVSMVGAVALATGAPTAVAVALAAVATAAVLLPRLPKRRDPGAPGTTPSGPRPGANLLATVAAVAAPLAAAGTSTLTAVLTGALGGVVLTEAAVRRTSTAAVTDARAAAEAESWAWVLAAFALVPGGLAMAVFASATGRLAAALAGGAMLASLVAALADRARTASADLPLGTLARIGAVSVLAGTASLPATEVGLVAVVVAVLSILDAVRLRRPEVALGASVAVPVAVGSLSHAAGLSLPSTGVALTVAAAVVAGLGSQLGRRWSHPVLAAVGLAIGSGLTLASADATATADALIVTGGIGLAAAIAAGRLDGVYGSGAVITGGTWLRLADGGVGASEPYLLPVCALLLIAGLRARSIGTSSWIAYGPLVGLLGGSALLERMAGGPGWHALVGGAVGILAVVAGGAWRLAAPLLLGSGLLVALVAFETLAITSGFPTWVWLGLGGSALLAAGVAMERHEIGPLETGRRLVDVVTDRYA
jgi:hypothetical protein